LSDSSLIKPDWKMLHPLFQQSSHPRQRSRLVMIRYHPESSCRISGNLLNGKGWKSGFSYLHYFILPEWGDRIPQAQQGVLA
jgi:hypothetical protein